MIKFSEDRKGLILRYSADFGGNRWLWENLKTDGYATISRVLTLQRDDLLEEPPEEIDEDFEYRFHFAERDGEYYRIAGRVFEIETDVLIVRSGIKFERRLFVAERNVSIFRHLADVIGAGPTITIGGAAPNNVPIEIFEQLIANFPNSSELNRYARARVANIIGEYFDGMKDFRGEYESYLSRRKTVKSTIAFRPSELFEAEIDKFVLIRDTIARWLRSSEGHTEKEWQTMILSFILLIFPKYVAVLEKVRIEDHYSRPGKITYREIDIALVDANGNLDVIEIKRPFDDALLSKTQYRGNFVPTKDLSGTIMQAEKYLFHLTKWGVAGEEKLTKKHAERLPSDLSIRITNPKALLILGRDRAMDGSAVLDRDQIFDLEVIKRKYANMMDIITYDDLLRRLDRIIASLEQRAAASS